MGYNLGPLHCELSLQQYRMNFPNNVHLQYYVQEEGAGTVEASKQAATVNLKRQPGTEQWHFVRLCTMYG